MINENEILLDWHDDTKFDATFLLSDSIAYKIDNIELAIQNESKHLLKSSGFGLSWQKKLGGTLEMLGGVASVGGGTVLILGSGAAEVLTDGISTPISIPGILSGLIMIKGGVDSFKTGYTRIFIPELMESPSDSWKSTTMAQFTTEGIIPWVENLYKKYGNKDNYSKYLIDVAKKQKNISNIAGWSSFIFTYTGDVIGDYGENYQWYDHYSYIMDDKDYKKVVTGLVKDIGSNCATIRGYVSTEINKSPYDGTVFNTEYGIILRSVNDKSDLHKFVIKDGNGGNFEYTFTDLKPDEEYKYFTYFYDISNNIIRLGDVKSFRTKKDITVNVNLSNFIVTKSRYRQGGFTNDGEKYDFRFDATLTAEISANDFSYVKEWGYIYEDPKGETIEIPLSGTHYVDSRYAYFRNSATSAARLYGYAYIVGFEKPRYYEVHDFPLVHNMAVANTGEYSNVTTSTATVLCSFENVPEGATCGIEYTDDNNWNKQSVNDTNKDGSHTVTLTGLQSGTKYEYRAFIDDAGQMYYGGQLNFTTEIELPDLSGTWNCTIYNDDDSVLAECKYEFSSDHKVTHDGSDRIPEGEIGSWSIDANGKVGVNFSWTGGSWSHPVWYAETYSGQANSTSTPSCIEGNVYRAWAGTISEHGNTYKFKMTK